MLKLPKGLKKKKKKSKKDQELFTEEELEKYKRDLRAKQEANAAKSDVGESDAASDVEGSEPSATVTNSVKHSASAGPSVNTAVAGCGENTTLQKSEEDEEWKKFKALTSGVDTILHKTQDELDRIKKESFYQRLPSAAEKKRLEEEEEARRRAQQIEEEKRLAAEREANRDKLAEAVVELSDFEDENEEEVDDIFGTDYVEAIASGELQLAVVPDSPVLEDIGGPDPFDTEYAEKVIVGAGKAKGNKKLVSLGAAVEVLSGRVDREHALALSKPKRKQRKGIQNLLLSESVDYEESEIELVTSEPTKNLLDELVSDVPEPDAPIDLSVSLHLHLIQPNKFEEEEKENTLEAEPGIDLSEFDTLKDDEDDEFAELAAESVTKPKDEFKIIKEISLIQSTVLEVPEVNWAEFETPEGEPSTEIKTKPARPPPPARPATGPHIVPGAIYISDDEGEIADDDPFNTAYAEQVIKKTTVLEEDDEFDPRATEISEPFPKTQLFAQPPIARTLSGEETEDYDPFDTSTVSAIVQSQSTKANTIEIGLEIPVNNGEFDSNRRKSSLSLNLQQKSVGFLVPSQNPLETENSVGGSKKPLTPYYTSPNISKESEDPFDTSYVPEVKPTEVELKHLERDLLQKATLKRSVSDPDFDPRAPPTPVPAEDLLAVNNNYINTKVLTPAQQLSEESPEAIDPFDTSIAANLKPGEVEIKLLESELLPEIKSTITTGVLDTLTDAQELGLGDKVLTPLAPKREISIPEEIDPFDTSIANNLAPGETEIKLLENELIN